MTGGFWRTTSRIWSASSWVFGTRFISTSFSIAPSGAIWVTRVLAWVTERTWSWFTGYGGNWRSSSRRSWLGEMSGFCSSIWSRSASRSSVWLS